MAVTIDADGLAEAIGVDSATGTRLLAVATALVNRYASAAPDAITNEATIPLRRMACRTTERRDPLRNRGRRFHELRAVDAVRASTFRRDGVAHSLANSAAGAI